MIPQYRTLKLKLPKYCMKKSPIPQYRKPPCPPRESSCPCYYSQIEGVGLHVVDITRYVIRIKKHVHNRNRIESQGIWIVTPLVSTGYYECDPWLFSLADKRKINLKKSIAVWLPANLMYLPTTWNLSNSPANNSKCQFDLEEMSSCNDQYHHSRKQNLTGY